MNDDKTNRDIEWMKREIADAASYAHKAMWYSAVAAVCGILATLKAGGLL